MSAPQYTVLNLDLSIARVAERVVDPGVPVTSLTIMAIPAGQVASFALGTNKPFIPVIAAGQEIDQICPPADEGIFIANPAGAGILQVYVAFSNAPQSIGG